MKTFISNSPKETQKIATEIISDISAPFIIALEGNLGAGKTVFVQGLAQSLDIKEAVNSPTFNIFKIYKTKHKTIKYLCHVDAYRLNSEQELRSLGIDEYIEDKNTLVVIEWADKVKSILPSNYLLISILTKSEKKREIKIERKNKN
ncbi:MAG: tRNA (adenosine(37)-N6)-threonylcarbamoyltransferase complex ATPase subunit type 1 TsaE [Candidatus Pacebacteria bacterium]|nr:tRNA (adenosine(37)-N6)-threonylcarbamoyltransferase complex ATPase subunit type 1 TsaE [Candidatus Paceibacterota bacterium]